MAIAKAHVLLPRRAAAAVAVVMSVAAVASLVAAASSPVSGNVGGGAMMMISSRALVEAAPPLLTAARGGNRVGDDEEATEMDSDAHRRLAVLVRRGHGYRPPHLSYGTLNPNKAACNPACSRRGEPYFPNHCKSKYHCPS